jgi:hypothetical protein
MVLSGFTSLNLKALPSPLRKLKRKERKGGVSSICFHWLPSARGCGQEKEE